MDRITTDVSAGYNDIPTTTHTSFFFNQLLVTNVFMLLYCGQNLMQMCVLREWQ